MTYISLLKPYWNENSNNFPFGAEINRFFASFSLKELKFNWINDTKFQIIVEKSFKIWLIKTDASINNINNFFKYYRRTKLDYLANNKIVLTFELDFYLNYLYPFLHGYKNRPFNFERAPVLNLSTYQNIDNELLSNINPSYLMDTTVYNTSDINEKFAYIYAPPIIFTKTTDEYYTTNLTRWYSFETKSWIQTFFKMKKQWLIDNLDLILHNKYYVFSSPSKSSTYPHLLIFPVLSLLPGSYENVMINIGNRDIINVNNAVELEEFKRNHEALFLGVYEGPVLNECSFMNLKTIRLDGKEWVYVETGPSGTIPSITSGELHFYFADQSLNHPNNMITRDLKLSESVDFRLWISHPYLAKYQKILVNNASNDLSLTSIELAQTFEDFKNAHLGFLFIEKWAWNNAFIIFARQGVNNFGEPENWIFKGCGQDINYSDNYIKYLESTQNQATTSYRNSQIQNGVSGIAGLLTSVLSIFTGIITLPFNPAAALMIGGGAVGAVGSMTKPALTDHLQAQQLRARYQDAMNSYQNSVNGNDKDAQLNYYGSFLCRKYYKDPNIPNKFVIQPALKALIWDKDTCIRACEFFYLNGFYTPSKYTFFDIFSNSINKDCYYFRLSVNNELTGLLSALYEVEQIPYFESSVEEYIKNILIKGVRLWVINPETRTE